MRGSSITVSWCRYDETSGRVSLVIPDLGPGDEGDYQCRADNPYGDSTCTITVSGGQLCYADQGHGQTSNKYLFHKKLECAEISTCLFQL